ncbi:uncharacterized protein LOC120894982 [Anopheles arabiensis]|uniref:uncharacterized protein LOC120894982 n=1 Tax=Anopheles arabiensis TaxID=7173 RepID=UPI001AAD079B|nr:uncharacterized protein LOC120894982 [Anopheles arabiensis]
MYGAVAAAAAAAAATCRRPYRECKRARKETTTLSSPRKQKRFDFDGAATWFLLCASNPSPRAGSSADHTSTNNFLIPLAVSCSSQAGVVENGDDGDTFPSVNHFLRSGDLTKGHVLRDTLLLCKASKKLIVWQWL